MISLWIMITLKIIVKKLNESSEFPKCIEYPSEIHKGTGILPVLVLCYIFQCKHIICIPHLAALST